MTADRLEQIHRLFEEVFQQPESSRAAFIQEACGSDVGLRSEIESLLQHDSQVTDDFLRTPEAPPEILRRPSGGGGDGADGAATKDLLIGERVGRYHIKALIAAGGMGNVYEAIQDQLRRVVAIKVMKQNLSSRSASRRFQLESQVLGRLRHPNIAQVYDAGTYDHAGLKLPYFAMEYVPAAKSLTDYCTQKRLGVRNKLRLFAKVCDAVRHGHQKGVIHRDLKPSNVLVDSGGEPKVIDFGVAKITGEEALLATQHTATGQIVGTIQYMSPEQCGDDMQDIDIRSDVYSLGVVLYELLTGQKPYEATGTSVFRAARTVREAAPKPLSGFGRRFRGDLQTIVLKALEKDRERRYQSAAELAADIRRFLNRDPIDARPPTTWTKIVRWITKHPVAATCTTWGIVLLLTVCATFAAVWLINSRPYDIQISSDGRSARLIAFSERPLYTWDTGGARAVSFAGLVDQPPQMGDRKLAIIGFESRAGSPWQPELCAFKLDDNYERPVWTRTLRREDIPVGAPSKWGPEVAAVKLGMVADVFPESDEPEIVAVHHLGAGSLCAIRIYDLYGTILYQTWHDGALKSCEWMPDEKLLVFCGLNSVGEWKDRGHPEFERRYPIVVFAIHPELGVLRPDLLPSSPNENELHLRWYKCVYPLATQDFVRTYCLKPAPGEDSGRRVLLELRFGPADNPEAAIVWQIDETGELESESRVVNDEYDDMRDALPDPNMFSLGPLPPIVSQNVSENGDCKADAP